MLSAPLVKKLCAHFDLSTREDLQCVLTGERAFLYPLYSRTLAKPFLGNYIPIAPRLIKQLEKDHDLSYELDPSYIQGRYRAHLAARKPVYAYACARLMVHVYKRPAYQGKYLSQILERATDALYCNRGRYSPDYAIHTVRYDIRGLPQASKMTPAAGLRLALEVAAYWNEYGHLEQATKWVNLGFKFEQISGDTFDEERAQRSANALRRKAQILLHSEPGNEDLEYYLDMVGNLMPIGKLSTAITTANLKSFRSFIIGGDFRPAAAALEKLFEEYSFIFGQDGLTTYTGGLSTASAAELYLYSGILLACIYKDVNRSQERLRVALRLMDESGHRLPLFIWRYIRKLRDQFKDAAQARLIDEISHKYVNEFDLTTDVQREFEFLENWLSTCAEENVMRTIINYGKYIEGDSNESHFHFSAEQDELLSELLISAKRLVAAEGLESGRKQDIVSAEQELKKTGEQVDKNPSTMRRAVIAMRDAAMSSLSKAITNEATQLVDGQIHHLLGLAERLLHSLPH